MSNISIDSSFHVLELWQAAYNGDVPKLEELLADPDLRSKINYKMHSQDNHTALFFACYGAANAETIRILISAGANPFLRDKIGRLPLHLAANTRDSELITALLEVPSMRSFRLDAATSTGQTPLHYLFLPDLGFGSAVKPNNADLSKCLPLFLEIGQDPLGSLHKKDHNGLSSLMLVKYYNLNAAFHSYVSPKTFEILLKNVSVPYNVEELLKSNLITPSLQYVFDNHKNFQVTEDIVYISTNQDAGAIQRPIFKP